MSAELSASERAVGDDVDTGGPSATGADRRESPPLRVLVGVALVAACTLALQVLLTRLFSAAIFYHFSFLAVSLALVGTGAGAIVLYVRPAWFDRQPLERVLARTCLLLAASLVVFPTLFVRLDLTYRASAVDPRFAINLGLACLLAMVPSLLAGTVIALTIRGYTTSVGRVYAFDLVGAGLGALAIVPLMWVLDAPTLIVGLGGVAAIAFALFAGPQRRQLKIIVVLVPLAATVLSATSSLNYLPPRLGEPPGSAKLADRWMPLSRVLGYSGRPYALLFYDRVFAPVPLYSGKGPVPDWRVTSTGPQSIGYELTGPGRALVIGGGGGRDIFTALSSGQRRVDVIELNSTIRDVVDKKLPAGSPYSLPRVHSTIGDGRSVLAATDTRYDQIHIGFTDTLSADSAQGFALTENNLYTLEAFDEYFDHLKPDGVLNVSRLYHLVGDEALRATILTLEALKRQGVHDPSRNVVVVLGREVQPFNSLFGTVLARKRPFTDAELRQIRTLAAARGEGIAFAPRGPYYKEWGDLARAKSIESFCSSYPLDVCAPTDDKPFFFYMKRLSDIGSSGSKQYLSSVDPVALLTLTLAILAVLSGLALVVPLYMVRDGQRPPLSQLLFFIAIGMGYLMLEIALIQRFVLFLGFPTYALSVVLFAVLIFTGIGSHLSSRWTRPRRALSVDLVVVAALIFISAFVLPPMLRGMIGLSFVARVLATIALLAPFGLTLGMAMPIGLRRLSGLHPSGVPWAWGVNGVASVLASVLAVFIAINFGFTVTTVLAGVWYLGALAHVRLGRWPASLA